MNEAEGTNAYSARKHKAAAQRRKAAPFMSRGHRALRHEYHSAAMQREVARPVRDGQQALAARIDAVAAAAIVKTSCSAQQHDRSLLSQQVQVRSHVISE
jgi:hypothetical protein